jgi:hypothetical protein
MLNPKLQEIASEVITSLHESANVSCHHDFWTDWYADHTEEYVNHSVEHWDLSEKQVNQIYEYVCENV